ncbi:hypothetical protein D3C79_653670 [compost metagenome]
MRRTAFQQAGQQRPHLAPGALLLREARQQLRWQVAGIQGPASLPGEAVHTGQHHGAQARQRRHLFPGDAFEQHGTDGDIAVVVPQPTRLEQAVGYPEIRVGGAVLIEQAPTAVPLLTPQPGGQKTGQIPAGELLLGPAQQAGEGLFVVVDQGEEEAVALPLRGGDAPTVGGVYDPPLLADVVLAKMLPLGPVTGRESGQGTQGPQQQGTTHSVHLLHA